MCEGGGVWEISVRSTQFYCEPKTTLKKILLEKIIFNSEMKFIPTVKHLIKTLLSII